MANPYKRVPPDQRLLLTRPEAVRLLGVGRETFEHLVDDGEITPVLIGKREHFARSDIEEFVTRRQDEWRSAREGAGRSYRNTATGGRIARGSITGSRCRVIELAEALKRTTPSSPPKSLSGSGKRRPKKPGSAGDL